MKHRLFLLILSLICSVGSFAQSDSLRVTIKTSKGVHILWDDEHESVGTLRIWTKPGTHKVRVFDDAGYDNSWDIEVGADTASDFNFPLEATVHVKADKPATVWVDGNLIGNAPQDLKLYGNHRVTIDAGKKYLLDKREMYFYPLEEKSIEAVMEKTPAPLYGFVLANYMYPSHSPGLMLGLGRRFGGYIKANITATTVIDPDYNRHFEYSEKGLPFGAYHKESIYQGVSGGVVFRSSPYLWVYAGSGYARYMGASVSYGDEYIRGYETVKGPLVDAGVLFRWKALLLQTGYSRIIGTSKYGHHFGAFNFGIGVTLHKHNKRIR